LSHIGADQLAGFIKKIARRASAKLAKREARKHIKKSPAEAFRTSWETLLSNQRYRFLVRVSQNPSREGTHARGRTFELLSREIPDFDRSIKISVSGNLKVALDSNKPFLAVQIHDGYRFLTRVLADHKREFTRIVPDPAQHIRWLGQRGIDVSRVHAVKKDVLSLTRLRKAVRCNHVICCAIDYSDAMGRRIYVSPAIFGFANRTRIPIFFVKGHVNDAGDGELVSAGPYQDVDPLVCAKEFLHFFNSVGDSQVDMKIRWYREGFRAQK
jgi:hypothetical protein